MKKTGRYKASGIETECEPGSRGKVLKNLLSIKNKQELEQYEMNALHQAEDVFFRTLYDKNHKFAVKDISKIHEIWLGKLYSWAGKYRNVELIKGNFRFASAIHIPKLMEGFEKDYLQVHTPCTFTSKNRVIQALAEVHAELILIHPFREGNGRVARTLSTIMALQAGFPILNFGLIRGRKMKEYIAAIHASLDKNYKLMKKLFGEILRRTISSHQA